MRERGSGVERREKNEKKNTQKWEGEGEIPNS